MKMPASFIAGDRGPWRIARVVAVRGEPLDPARALTVVEDGAAAAGGAAWVLRGVRSHDRYTTRAEKDQLTMSSPPLGRPGMHAALIPIRKSAAWWQLAQDERRAVIERSRHFPIGLEALPAVNKAGRITEVSLGWADSVAGRAMSLASRFRFVVVGLPTGPRGERGMDALIRARRSDRREVELRLVPASDGA